MIRELYVHLDGVTKEDFLETVFLSAIYYEEISEEEDGLSLCIDDGALFGEHAIAVSLPSKHRERAISVSLFG